MLKRDDVEGEYTDPILSSDLTTSLDFEQKPKLMAKPDLPLRNVEPAFRTNSN